MHSTTLKGTKRKKEYKNATRGQQTTRLYNYFNIFLENMDAHQGDDRFIAGGVGFCGSGFVITY